MKIAIKYATEAMNSLMNSILVNEIHSLGTNVDEAMKA
jgi:hypothetical protein